MFPSVDEVPGAEERPLEDIAARLCELQMSIAAAQGEQLALLGEFVERGGHERWEVFPDQWVSWKLGVGTAESRRMVATAKRLRVLPRLTEACRAGRIPPSLAGLMSRTATPASEEALVEMASYAATSKIERICRTKMRIEAERRQRETARQRNAARQAAAASGDAGDADADPDADVGGAVSKPAPPQARYLSYGAAEGGGWEGHTWLPSAEGARVELALERARTWLRGAGRPPHPDVVAGVRDLWATNTAADALLVLAETVLSLGCSERRAADRHQVVVHVELENLAAALDGSADPSSPAAYTAGGAAVDAGALARIACNSRLVGLVREAGRAIRIGDPTEVVPAHIERAVLARQDHVCDYTTCGSTRGIEVHHVIHRHNGGTHDPDHLVGLCWAHHDAHHRGDMTITRTATPGRFRYLRRDGTEVHGRPPPPDHDPEPLPPPVDAAWADDRAYGDPLTRWGLDVILHHVFKLEAIERGELVGPDF